MPGNEKRPGQSHAPIGNGEGEFGLPGMIKEHHPPDCTCRPCRRITKAATKRRRKKIARDLVRGEEK